jgi:hypothetical protein
MKIGFSRQTFEKCSSLIKIRPVGAELFHTDRRTDRHDETNSPFRNSVNAPKRYLFDSINYCDFN